MIQNDKISKVACPSKLKKVLTFTPVDEDVLYEHTKQFPKGYKYRCAWK